MATKFLLFYFCSLWILTPSQMWCCFCWLRSKPTHEFHFLCFSLPNPHPSIQGLYAELQSPPFIIFIIFFYFKNRVTKLPNFAILLHQPPSVIQLHARAAVEYVFLNTGAKLWRCPRSFIRNFQVTAIAELPTSHQLFNNLQSHSSWSYTE